MKRRPVVLLAPLLLSAAAALLFVLAAGRTDRSPPQRPPIEAAAARPPPIPAPLPVPPPAESAPAPPRPETPTTPPPEVYECSLELTFRDAKSGEPAAGAARLWRLDVPAREGWTEGDSLERKVEVPAEGLLVEELPTGMYRAQIVSQGVDAEDPPEFLVGGAFTAVTLPVESPQDVRVSLRIVDDEGRPIEEAEREQGAESVSTVDAGLPAWAEPRRSTFGGAGVSVSSASVSVLMRNRGQRTSAVDGVFDLGTVRGDTRSTRVTRPFSFTIPERARVSAAARGAYGRNTTLLAVAPLLSIAAAAVVLPDGSSALGAGAAVEASCEAVPEPVDFRQVPVRVRVTLLGYEPLDFEWRAGDTGAPQVLKPVR